MEPCIFTHGLSITFFSTHSFVTMEIFIIIAFFHFLHGGGGGSHLMDKAWHEFFPNYKTHGWAESLPNDPRLRRSKVFAPVKYYHDDSSDDDTQVQMAVPTLILPPADLAYYQTWQRLHEKLLSVNTDLEEEEPVAKPANTTRAKKSLFNVTKKLGTITSASKVFISCRSSSNPTTAAICRNLRSSYKLVMRDGPDDYKQTIPREQIGQCKVCLIFYDANYPQDFACLAETNVLIEMVEEALEKKNTKKPPFHIVLVIMDKMSLKLRPYFCNLFHSTCIEDQFAIIDICLQSTAEAILKTKKAIDKGCM